MDTPQPDSVIGYLFSKYDGLTSMEYKLAIGVSNRHIRVQMNYNYYDK